MKRNIMTGIALLSVPLAVTADLADPEQIRPLKEFTPPKPITPNIAQGYMIENQFDRVDRTSISL